MRVRPTYTEEFKADAVALLRSDDQRSVPQIAEDLGVSVFSLRAWYKQNQMGKKGKKKPKRTSASAVVPANETLEQKVARLEREKRRLERENETLKEDREILKKAAAFFAKESE
jgi:transposase